jgi:hypothetical protein
VDGEALRDYAADGQGRVLDPTSEQAEADVWKHDILADAFPTPIWPWLLLLAIVLVPLDVGVRRVALTRADLGRARGWVARRVGRGMVTPEAAPGLAELRAARDRRSRLAERPPRQPADAVPAPPQHASAEPPPAPVAPQAPAHDERPAETLAERLARRRRER